MFKDEQSLIALHQEIYKDGQSLIAEWLDSRCQGGLHQAFLYVLKDGQSLIARRDVDRGSASSSCNCEIYNRQAVLGGFSG